jgi:hypothetical protein
VSTMNYGRHASARRDPLVVGLKFDAKLVVEDTQIAVAIARNRLRPNRLYFLCHYADISAVAVVVAKAIVAEAVGKIAKQSDVMLEPDV